MTIFTYMQVKKKTDTRIISKMTDKMTGSQTPTGHSVDMDITDNRIIEAEAYYKGNKQDRTDCQWTWDYTPHSVRDTD